MSNNLKVEITNLDDIEIYELLLQGTILSFPSGFWANRSEKEAKKVAIKLLKYLIDEKLKFNKEDVRLELSKMFLTKYKLHTASKLFGRSAINYIISTYPDERYKPWQFKHDKVPQSYWTQERNRISALKYVFEVELQWSLDDIKEKLDWEIMKKQGVYTLHSYYPSIHRICNALYPGIINPWELRHAEVSDYFWQEINNRKNAVKWLVQEKLKLKHTQISSRLKKEHFLQYGLTELFSNQYNCSVKKAINEVFPEREG
ncbi:DUF4046 domain-containing protein [Clostridium sp. CM028]|uniref:DUF4046 domain-containing protein n=1 Tax=Clostridium sp. CM028 TaxID=2851575 RepID=UPI001C6EBEA3|nr:DUF4046 domain-containing protein [Clostridium sp. CM028]MBW9150364.1 DUF4046 domain-containing protein [Clostridium sp. CM028]WLC63540.1 DUF4046 domain-containing protein [Clostridium sp. CM028]